MKFHKHILIVVFAMCALIVPAHGQQRSGGGRGARGEGTATQGNNVEGYLLMLNDRLNRVSTNGAWWTNAALLTRLGITEDQKVRIERTFENHRPRLETARATLEKEETQLGQLVNTEPFDRNAALTQAFRVNQARSEMERENTLMTLEMREHLTLAQWTQLPQPSISLHYTINTALGAGGRGPRGQQ